MNQVGVLTDADRLGLLIKETQAVLHQRMEEALRPLGLSVAQYACLQALRSDPGITSSELARRVFVSRQSANVLVRALERRGLVERAADPGPRRQRATTVTPAAAGLLDRGYDAVAQVVADMAAALEPAEITQAMAVLTSCRDRMLGRREPLGLVDTESC